MSKKVTSNPFFNFIKSYSARHPDWPVTKIAVEGARLWHSMCPSDRVRFVKEAEVAKKKKRAGGSVVKKRGRRGSILKKGGEGVGRSLCHDRGRRGHRRRRSKSRRRRKH